MTWQALWPWLAIVGLGLFHGLNPAMGWLFAVALGLHRGSRGAVLAALPPMAAGHALSIVLVAGAAVAFGVFVAQPALHVAAGAALIAWAAWHWRYGHRHRVRVGMTVGLAGLALWSFLMATAHGAGLMLVPALLPLCTGMPDAGGGSLPLSMLAVALHVAVTLAVTTAVALLVYDRLGLDVLRRRWINFDRLWTGALALTGAAMIATG